MEAVARRIVIAGGGTGGHLFPALAVADELRRRHPQLSITFVGGRRGIERRLVPAAGYPLRTLRVSGIKGKSAAAGIGSALSAAWAVSRCAAWMLAARPHLVIGVGGYASGPAVLAAKLLSVRTMVLEQNHFPGATNRWLAPRVDAVCLPSEMARARLGGIGIVTGNPVRRPFLEIGEPPGGGSCSLLIFGGSRGARSINRAVVGALPRLSAIDPAPRIVHQTGSEDELEVRTAYAVHPDRGWQVHAFLDDMPERLAAADLVLCRAGATTLAELAAAGRPAILVPFPHAADDHQRKNAEAVQQAGAAEVILDRELDPGRLAETVTALARDTGRRRAMAHAARGLARMDAAERIADVAERVMTGRPLGRSS